MVSRPVIIGSKYLELLEEKVDEIKRNNVKPIPLSEVKGLPRISKTFKCYCNRCNHETIEPHEDVYFTPFGVIKASCIQIFWKNNLFKMHYNTLTHEGFRYN